MSTSHLVPVWGKRKSSSGLATALCPWKQEVGAISRLLALGHGSQVDLGQAGMT